MNNLTDIYYAAIKQYDQMLPTEPSYDYCKAECDRREKEMMDTLSDEQKKLFKNFMECYYKIEATKEEVIYRRATLIGIRLTAETFVNSNSNCDIAI